MSLNDAAEAKQRLEQSRKLLSAASQGATAVHEVKCQKELLQEGAVVEHGGQCKDCAEQGKQVWHSIERNELARREGEALIAHLQQNSDIGDPHLRTAALKEKGNMFGVLVCVDKDGNEVKLQAFSGTFDSTGIAQDNDKNWCQPVAPSVQDDPQAMYLARQSIEIANLDLEAMQFSPEQTAKTIKDLKVQFENVEEMYRQEFAYLKSVDWEALKVKPDIKQVAPLASSINFQQPKEPISEEYLKGLYDACNNRLAALGDEENRARLIKERRENIASKIDHQTELGKRIKVLDVSAFPCFLGETDGLKNQLLNQLKPLVATHGIKEAVQAVKNKLTGVKGGDPGQFSILAAIGRCKLWDITNEQLKQLTEEERLELGQLQASINKKIADSKDPKTEFSEDYIAISQFYDKINKRKSAATKALATIDKDLQGHCESLKKNLVRQEDLYEEKVNQSSKARATRKIKNFAGQEKTMTEACIVSSAEGNFVGNNQLGACAAPKLFAEAIRRDIVPVALSEFWFGKDEQSRKSGVFYDSCQYCRSILGFMLHGLKERQEELAKALKSAQEGTNSV
jgi:hypothetical protein